MSAVLVSVDNGVLRATLNRPDKLNACTPEMLALLRAAIQRAADEPGIRAVLLTGAGRGFCAGQDLSLRNPAAGAAPIDLSVSLGSNYNPLIRRMRELPKPIVAAVNGVAAGAGANNLPSSDVAFFARPASLFPAVSRFGLLAPSPGTPFFPRVGRN